METFIEKWPEADQLIKAGPQEAGKRLMEWAAAMQQGGGFFPEAVERVAIGGDPGTVGYPPREAATVATQARRERATDPNKTAYPIQEVAAVSLFMARVWNHLEQEGLICDSPGVNGRNGWRSFTEKGEKQVEKIRDRFVLPGIHAAEENEAMAKAQADRVKAGKPEHSEGLPPAPQAAQPPVPAQQSAQPHPSPATPPPGHQPGSPRPPGHQGEPPPGHGGTPPGQQPGHPQKPDEDEPQPKERKDKK